MAILRVGFFGAGLIAASHAAGLERAGLEHELVGVYDPDMQRRDAFAERWQVPTCDSEAEVFDRSDAVYVCTWTSEHARLVDEACRRGLAVFCEKPLAFDAAAATAMTDAVEAAEVVNQVGLVLRYSPAFRLLADLVADPAAGRVMSVTFRDDQYIPVQGMYASSWRGDRTKACSGTLLEHSIHDIDILEHCIGPVASVSARSANFHGLDGIEDAVATVLQFESGAVGVHTTIWHDVLERPSLRRVEVFCERRHIVVENDALGPMRWQTTGEAEVVVEGDALLAVVAQRASPPDATRTAPSCTPSSQAPPHRRALRTRSARTASSTRSTPRPLQVARRRRSADELRRFGPHASAARVTLSGVIDHFHSAWDELTAPGTMFEMTDTEVGGIPMRVFASAPPSMRFVWEMALGYSDRTYIVFEDERYTYAEVDAQVRALAHHLRDVHGVGSGDRVAIAMRNYPEWVVAYWATLSIGAAAVGMNAWWTTPEMQYALDDSRPTVLIADGERVERVLPVLDELRASAPLHLLTVRYDGELPDDAARWDDVVRPDDAPDGLPAADIDPDDDATIFYTSGTTGFPKGAQLTHRGCIHNLLHIIFMGQVGAATAAAVTAASGEATAEAADAPAAPAAVPVIMAPTPLFHVTANNCLLHPATIGGGTIVLTYKWDPGRALELIEREGVTNFSGVPTMSREMLTHPDWATRDTSSLAAMGGGGAPVPPDLVGKIDSSLSKGAPSTGYGLTETCGILTGNAGPTYLAKPSSAGPIVPTVDAKVVDEDGNEVPFGEPGRLLVKGPIVIKGYLNKPEATAESIVDGWFDTGDIAQLDEDGFVYIVDRAKDMVLRGGENVYCSEVEAAIYDLDGVAEVAVFGVPDERLGEEVAAAVVLAEGASMDADELRVALVETLAKHKHPRHVWFLDEPLPRNANGKFVKRELRDRLVDEMP